VRRKVAMLSDVLVVGKRESVMSPTRKNSTVQSLAWHQSQVPWIDDKQPLIKYVRRATRCVVFEDHMPVAACLDDNPALRWPAGTANRRFRANRVEKLIVYEGRLRRCELIPTTRQQKLRVVFVGHFLASDRAQPIRIVVFRRTRSVRVNTKAGNSLTSLASEAGNS